MARQLKIQLAEQEADAIESIATATSRTPEVLAKDWLLERLTTFGLVQRTEPMAAPRQPEPDSQIERLRQRYKPHDVAFLLVGESAPAGGSFFYQADSNLFHATREAFIRAMGPMPEGSGFLDKFKELGFWLYDMVEGPINRTRGRPRKNAVNAGTDALAEQLRDLDPDTVIGIKTSLEGPIKAAALAAGIPAYRTLVLPFPLYQWREDYIAGLARFLTGNEERSGRADSPISPDDAGSSAMTLHAAMADVLASAGGGPLPARHIANEVASRRLYARRDGGRADYQQILLRAKKYPQTFEVTSSGVSLSRSR